MLKSCETNALTVYGSTNGTSFTQVSGTNDVYDLTGYSYVKVMKNGSGAAYCASLSIEIEAQTATNLANYIMYEDTNSQCETKFSVAKGYFEDMSTSERNTFMTSSDYVISTARERLEAWAKNQGKEIVHINDDYVIQSSLADIQNLLSQDNSTSVLLIIFASIVTLSFTSLILILKKKRLNKNNRA